MGALSLIHILRKTADNRTPGASGTQSKVGFDFPGRSAAGAAVLVEDARPEIRRSYSHSSFLPSGEDRRRWNTRRGVDVDRGGHSERERGAATSAAASLGLLALEIGEVEPHAYEQLALLCSVRNYAVARVQLAHPSALRSILCLLKVGSPRVQR